MAELKYDDPLKFQSLFSTNWNAQLNGQEVTNLDLLPVLENYRASLLRIQQFQLYAPALVRSTTITARAVARANVAMGLDVVVDQNEIERRGLTEQWFNKQYEFISQERAERDRNRVVFEVAGIQQGMYHFGLMLSAAKEGDAIYAATVAILEILLVSAWTAFEAMAGDLWTAAVNCHPKNLARLSGFKNRIEARANTRRQEVLRKFDGRKTVNQIATDKKAAAAIDEPKSKVEINIKAIDKLTQGTFDVEGKWGRILHESEVVKFSSLYGIRSAYSLAFADRSEKIDEFLSDPCFDTLSAVRNLMVHQNGRADREYVDQQKFIPNLPSLQLGQKLRVDGQIVSGIADPVLVRCYDLLTSVNEWLKIP